MASDEESAAALPGPDPSGTSPAKERGLPLAEVWLEAENAPTPNVTLPSNFMTRDQAPTSGKFTEDEWQAIETRMWDSVVQVVVPATMQMNGRTVNAIGKGTGFVTLGPPLEPKVLTNFHVLEDYRGDLNKYDCKPPIKVKFFFDTPGEEGVQERTVTAIEYFSKNSGRVNIVNRKLCDFAMLSVENIPQGVESIPLSAGGKRKARLLQLNHCVVIGHPSGLHKHITIVELIPGRDDFVQMYSKEGTKKGSSGSPVLIDGTAYFLHRHTGGGINPTMIIDIINEESKTKELMKARQAEFQRKYQIQPGD